MIFSAISLEIPVQDSDHCSDRDKSIADSGESPETLINLRIAKG